MNSLNFFFFLRNENIHPSLSIRLFLYVYASIPHTLGYYREESLKSDPNMLDSSEIDITSITIEWSEKISLNTQGNFEDQRGGGKKWLQISRINSRVNICGGSYQ